MGRIRTIKPDFPQSESMGRVSRDARLTFVLLWTIADDSGRLRGNSRMLASLLFPYDTDARELLCGWLGELEREGCIIQYKIDNDSYIQICKWLEHQRIDKPSASKFPPFHEPSRALDEPSRALLVGMEGNGEERKGWERNITPLPPKGGLEVGLGGGLLFEGQGPAMKPSPKKSKTEKLAPYRQDVVEALQDLKARWPKERDGKTIQSDLIAAASNVERILTEHPDVKLQLLIEATNAWLELPNLFPNAMQFFFGPGKPGHEPPWKKEVRALLTLRSNKT